jgi:hypothetical protein
MSNWFQPLGAERIAELTAQKLFGFQVEYATGQSDFGLVIATSEETARLAVEQASFATIKHAVIKDQMRVVDLIHEQYRGLAYFTSEAGCN